MTARRRTVPGDSRGRPWYADGVRFECQPDCGGCCVNHGDYAYVYLEPGEPERMAEFLGIDLAEFTSRFTTRDDDQTVLRMDEPACPFLDGTRCTVYRVRPLQCCTFPFWEENLRSPASWRKVATFCPGIDRGPTHPLEVIQDQMAARGTRCGES